MKKRLIAARQFSDKHKAKVYSYSLKKVFKNAEIILEPAKDLFNEYGVCVKVYGY